MQILPMRPEPILHKAPAVRVAAVEAEVAVAAAEVAVDTVSKAS